MITKFDNFLNEEYSDSDYNCPYCKKFDPYLEKIVEKHPDVAVVFKFLPFRSESSLTAARDALTVWRAHPEKFMKLNHTLMAKKGYHDDASIQEAQKRAGVSVTTPDEESSLTIRRSLIVAEKMGISPSWLSQMSSGFAAISAVRAVEFETATNGEINRKGMFPATWPKIWPELADVA